MKKINKILFLLLGFGFLACQSSKPEAPTKQGSLALLMDGREGKDIPATMVKSTAVPTVDVDTFHVVIRNEDGNKVSSASGNFDTFEELRQVGMPLLLPIGNYTAEASSGVLPIAAFDNPCYRGTKEFFIEENVVSEVSVHCTPQSLKVTLKYTDNFHALIKPNYKITVTNGVGGTLVFTKGETRSGYFSLDMPMTLHVDGEVNPFGTRVDYAANLKNVSNGTEQALKMGDHLIVTLDAEKISPPAVAQTSRSSRSSIVSIKAIELR